MTLTSRDAVASVLADTAIAVAAPHLAGTDVLGSSGVRPVAGLVFGLGRGVGLASGITTDPLSPRHLRWMAALGVISTISGAVALVFGVPAALAALPVSVAIAWLSGDRSPLPAQSARRNCSGHPGNSSKPSGASGFMKMRRGDKDEADMA